MSLSFSPEQKKTWLWIAAVLLLAWLFYQLGPIMGPFIAAGILAYMLNPAVDWLTKLHLGRFRMPRVIAVSLVLLLVVALLLGLMLVVVPVVQKEFVQLREQIPALLTRLNDSLGPRLRAHGIDINLDGAGLQQLLTEQFATSSDEIWAAILASARVGGMAVVGWLATLSLIPFVLFYLLQDWHSLIYRINGMVPPRWRTSTLEHAREVDSLLAQYLRGQLSVMIALAIYYSVTLWLVGLEVALPIGIITGLLAFVPYLGFGLGVVLAMLAAVLQFDSLQGIILVGLVYGLGQAIESFILTPKLVGERIGLPPLVVIFALLAFGQLFGFVGVLLALPATAVLSVALKYLRRTYLQSSFYNQS